MREDLDLQALRWVRNLCWAIGAALVILALTIGCPIRFPNLPGPAPTPTPTPPLPATCPDGFPPGPDGCPPPVTPDPLPGGDITSGDWVIVAPRPPAQYADQINAALVRLTSCEPPSRCPVKQEMFTFLGKVVVEVRRSGLNAGIQPGADEVAVGVKPYEVQGYHVFTCDPGCNTGVVGWAPGSVRDTWHAVENPPITSAPCPPLTNLKIKVTYLNPGSGVVDVTPRGPDCARCATINKGCDAGVCPLGPEGTPEFDAQRMACEDANGPYVFTFEGRPCDVDGSPCFHQNSNPLTVKVLAAGTVRVRAANGVGAEVVVNPQ